MRRPSRKNALLLAAASALLQQHLQIVLLLLLHTRTISSGLFSPSGFARIRYYPSSAITTAETARSKIIRLCAQEENNKLLRSVDPEADLLLPQASLEWETILNLDDVRPVVEAIVQYDLDKKDETTNFLQSTTCTADDNKMSYCYFNYDIGHAGRFTAFGSGGGSVDADDVILGGTAASSSSANNKKSKSTILAEIARDWTYRAPSSITNNDDDETIPSELIVFAPGLNTLHQSSNRTAPARTAPMRVAHYSNILSQQQPQKFRMAQLHLGTQMDQGPLTIYPVGDDLAALLQQNDLVPPLQSLSQEGWTLQARQRDAVQCALSCRNLIDTPLKQSFLKLIDTAVEAILEDDSSSSSPPNLVLMAYSRATAELAAALQTYTQQALARDATLTQKQLRDRLRRALTVVTIGAAANWFPEGPAYIHVSLWQDRLTQKYGVQSNHTKGGGGDEALYLHTDSIYNTQAPDAHNAGACVLQFLALVMRSNGCSTLRGLYDKNQEEKSALYMPPNMSTELFPAMIVATKGDEWLWFPDDSLVNVTLPAAAEARTILDREYGAGTYESIAERNAPGLSGIMEAFWQEVANSNSAAISEGSTTDIVDDPLAAKYAAIDDLGERAFAILVDLGMVQRTD